MTATSNHRRSTRQGRDAATGRTIPSSSTVMSVAVQVAGIVPVRLDLNHLGAPEQQLGMSLGTVLVYLRTAGTARTVAEGWGRAAVLARSLSVAVAGRRPLVVVGPSTIAAIVQLAGVPQVTAEYEPSRADGAAAMLRIQVGPVEWQVRDANAYTSMLRAWRQAARLLGENPTEYE